MQAAVQVAVTASSGQQQVQARWQGSLEGPAGPLVAFLDVNTELHLVIDAVQLRVHCPRLSSRHYTVAQPCGTQHAALTEGPLADGGTEGLIRHLAQPGGGRVAAHSGGPCSDSSQGSSKVARQGLSLKCGAWRVAVNPEEQQQRGQWQTPSPATARQRQGCVLCCTSPLSAVAGGVRLEGSI